MEKTYTTAGMSMCKGKNVWRFANGTAASRTKVLVKNGDTCIALWDLPNAMTRDAAIAYVTPFLNDTQKSEPKSAPVAAAKTVTPGKRELKRQEKAAQAAADRVRRKESDANFEKVKASVNKNDINFPIDEDAIPDFIRRDFRR